MRLTRRSTIGLLSSGVFGSLAGCIDEDQIGADGNETTLFTTTETIGLAFATSRRSWDIDSDTIGEAVVIDTKARLNAVLAQYGLTPETPEPIENFVAGVDFEDTRLLLVESSGPNLCYDTIEFDGVGVEDGVLQAEATVIDTSDEDEGCAEAVSFPSILVKITFEEEPVDSVEITINDGWDETSTVAATAADSISVKPAELPGYISPESDPEPTDPLVCDDDEFERFPQGFDDPNVHLGNLETDGEITWALRTKQRQYTVGDTVTIYLTNVTDDSLTTGNQVKYNLQVYTEDGWEELRGNDEGLIGYPLDAYEHPPGDGFRWSFEMEEDAIAEETHAEARVCPALEPGRYRFVFFGVSNGAITVEFDLETGG